MAVEITHIRMSAGGSAEQHITDYRWRSLEDGEIGTSNKPTMVEWINKGNDAYVGQGNSRVSVGVIRPQAGQPYLRTYADGQWTNNLLSLPRI